MAISGMPTPEICFLPGQFRLMILPKEHQGKSLSVCELDTTFQLRGGHSVKSLTPKPHVFF